MNRFKLAFFAFVYYRIDHEFIALVINIKRQKSFFMFYGWPMFINELGQYSISFEKLLSFLDTLYTRVSHMLNNWVDDVSDDAYYPWEPPKKID